MKAERRELLALKARADVAKAQAAFRRGLGGALRGLRLGPLRSVAAAYVPYRLFAVDVTNRGATQTLYFALDAVEGVLDLYEFESPPESDVFETVESRNWLAARLDVDAARRALVTRVQRLLFQTGFFRMRRLEIQPRDVLRDFFVPYWLGFFGSGETAELGVMDAVRGTLEGGKARELFRRWLLE